MTFPRYPKYKDGGVEWLGEVPQHWLVARTLYCERLGASPRFFCPLQVGKPSFMSQPHIAEPAASAVPLTEARP